MNNSTNKPIELTDYDFRDTRKVSFVRYCSLEQELNARHEREAQWDATHRLLPIARWVVNQVRSIKDRFAEDDIQEALDMANPMAGFNRWKARNKKRN